MDLDLKLDSLNIADCVEVKRRKLSETSTSFLEETETEEDLEEDMSTEFDCEGETTLRRSTRRKIRPLDTQNRRTFTKPRKIIDGSNMTEVKNYYLDKRVKRLPSNLETIFEEPQSEAFMSGRKFKRCITFTDNLKASNKLKTKKRVMKAKKLSAKKRVNSKKKVTLELLLEKLSSLENADF